MITLRRPVLVGFAVLLMAGIAVVGRDHWQASYTLAQPVAPVAEPNTFEGSVTINGYPAPDGTVVVAMVDSVACASATTVQGRYRLVVEVFRCGSPMQEVVFLVVGPFGVVFKAPQTAVLGAPLPPPRTVDLTGLEPAVTGPLSPRLSTGCSVDFPGRAKVTFIWEHGMGESEWVDLSLFDNGFQPGTFVGAGPLPILPDSHNLLSSTFTWDDLVPNTEHYWRVNTLGYGMWVASPTQSFVTPDCASNRPLAATQLRVTTQDCGPAAEGTRAVTFEWRPDFFEDQVSGMVHLGEQWVDISEVDDTFAPGTFVGYPAPPGIGQLLIQNVGNSGRVFWRVNTRWPGWLAGPNGWRSSITQYLDFISCPGGLRPL